MTSSRPESVFGTHRTNDSPWDDSVIPGGAFFYPGIPPRSGAAGAAGEASSSQTAYPSPRRRRQDTILPGSPWDKPSPHAKKARGTGPRALVSSASISTYRPCRERRERRGVRLRRRGRHIPRPAAGGRAHSFCRSSSPRQDTILPGPPWDKPSPHAKKARGTGPRALVSSASISTCRPCRERREQREREARACRPPGSRWSAAHRPRRRHSPERNGSPWWGPRCRRRSCRSRSRSGR